MPASVPPRVGCPKAYRHREEGRLPAQPNAFPERKFRFLAERSFAFAHNYALNTIVAHFCVSLCSLRRVPTVLEARQLLVDSPASVYVFKNVF